MLNQYIAILTTYYDNVFANRKNLNEFCLTFVWEAS